jgi:hypothetical protein
MRIQVSSVVGQMAKALMIVLALITARPSLAQSSREDRLQPLVSRLRTCVRSNAARAYASGIRTEADAVAFFRQRCDTTIKDELAKGQDLLVPPGLLRIVMREEWAAFMASSNGK